MSSNTIHIGLMTLDLFIPMANSLKSKRAVTKSLKDRIHAKFNASVAEVGLLDKWQKCVYGICVIGNERKYVDSCLQKILSLVESSGGVEVLECNMEML